MDSGVRVVPFVRVHALWQSATCAALTEQLSWADAQSRQPRCSRRHTRVGSGVDGRRVRVEHGESVCVPLECNCRVCLEGRPPEAGGLVHHNKHVCVPVCVCLGLQTRPDICAYAVCAQGVVQSGFAGVNKCTVQATAVGEEYSPRVQVAPRGTHPPVPPPQPPVSSGQSLCVGDVFCVIKVGTVGRVLAGSEHTMADADGRHCVLHAALVHVRPTDGSAARFEVLTGEQLNPVVGQVEWHRCGLPPMDPRLVKLCVPEWCYCLYAEMWS